MTTSSQTWYLYQLKDGSLLQADLAAFQKAELVNHHASNVDTRCFLHQVNLLQVVELPSFEQVDVYQF
jgi:hypothetical protein